MEGRKGLCLGIIHENHWEKWRKNSCGNFFHKISIGKTFFKKRSTKIPTHRTHTLSGDIGWKRRTFPHNAKLPIHVAKLQVESHLAKRLDVLWDLLQLLLQSTFSWTWKHWHLASKLANVLGKHPGIPASSTQLHGKPHVQLWFLLDVWNVLEISFGIR